MLRTLKDGDEELASSDLESLETDFDTDELLLCSTSQGYLPF